MENILSASMTELAEGIATGKLKSAQVTQKFMEQTEKHNPKINAFITLNEKSLELAESIDKKIAAGEKLGPLAGVPVGIKDMLCTKGLKTTAGSKMLSSYVPPYSSTVVNKLEAAGAITFAKCNQDEFAMGSSNEISAAGLVAILGI